MCLQSPTRLSSTDDKTDRSARDPECAADRLKPCAIPGALWPAWNSKTTLVEALARRTPRWQFVEILASEFPHWGVDAVPARVYLIFRSADANESLRILFDESTS